MNEATRRLNKAGAVFAVFLFFLLPTGLRADDASGTESSFGFDFYRVLCSSEENILFSPLGIRTAFSMVHAGTAGNTAEQIADVFGLGREQEKSAELHRIFKSVDDINSSNDGTLLLFSNSLWPLLSGPIKSDYIALLQTAYKSGVFPVDFLNDASGATKQINEYVSNSTRGNIKRLLSHDMNPNTQFALLNVIFFKGSWQYLFDEAFTLPLKFQIDGERSVETDFMHQETIFKYYEEELFQLIELPYNNDSISMLIILPRDNDSLLRIEENISTGSVINRLEQMYDEPVSLYLPRFEIETDLDLKPLLISMGITDAFDILKADFSNMTESGNRLCINFAKHAARINVNEEGSEAAAATIVGGCFPAGTPVLTNEGIIPVEQIKQGDRLRTFDFRQKRWEESSVSALYSYNYTGEMISITLDDSEIRATVNHPFYVIEGRELDKRRFPSDIIDKNDDLGYDGRWVEAGDLLPGDLLMGFANEGSVIRSTKTSYESEMVYNLAVDGTHNYTVTSRGFLVHNKGAQEAGPVMFYANHPFIFLIRDNLSGENYFVGRLMNPQG